MSTKKDEDRVKIINGLWTLLRYANNETYFFDSLSEGIPDDSTPDDEEIKEIIVNNDEDFEMWLNMYLKSCAMAAMDGGFYGLLNSKKSTKDLSIEDFEL